MNIKKSTISALGATIALAATVSIVLAGGKPFNILMNGASEVPGPGDPDGSGNAHITLNQGQGEVCYKLEVANITLPAIGAHIHEAPEGVAGPVIIPLTAPDVNGVSEGCVDNLEKDFVKEIRENPEEYYVNVHTSDHPAGAVRGQLK